MSFENFRYINWKKKTEAVPFQSADIMSNNLFHWTCFNKTQTIDNRDVKLFKQIKDVWPNLNEV